MDMQRKGGKETKQWLLLILEITIAKDFFKRIKSVYIVVK